MNILFNSPIPENIAGSILEIAQSLQEAGDEHHANWAYSLLDGTYPKSGETWVNKNNYRVIIHSTSYMPKTDTHLFLVYPEWDKPENGLSAYTEQEFAEEFSFLSK